MGIETCPYAWEYTGGANGTALHLQKIQLLRRQLQDFGHIMRHLKL